MKEENTHALHQIPPELTHEFDMMKSRLEKQEGEIGALEGAIEQARGVMEKQREKYEENTVALIQEHEEERKSWELAHKLLMEKFEMVSC